MTRCWELDFFVIKGTWIFGDFGFLSLIANVADLGTDVLSSYTLGRTAEDDTKGNTAS